jgi:5-formyltetrahydrofolate cyclo-ligase
VLAFDRRGYRLGYGGGYYDRTLAALRAERAVTAIGIAFAAQEVSAVPHDRHDQPLDWVVTEREAIRMEKKI